MTSATASEAARTADCVNPVLTATREVFERMLGCTPRRTGLALRGESPPGGHVSGVVCVTGGASGSIVVRLPKAAALAALKRMTGTEAAEIDDQVRDAVGELTNMIAGSARSTLADIELALSPPQVVAGETDDVSYPADVQPFCILFDSDLGPFQIEIGLSCH
jgi:chemotaxis protein CheX